MLCRAGSARAAVRTALGARWQDRSRRAPLQRVAPRWRSGPPDQPHYPPRSSLVSAMLELRLPGRRMTMNPLVEEFTPVARGAPGKRAPEGRA